MSKSQNLEIGKPRKKNRSISFSPELMELLKIEAKAQSRSVNWLVGEFVRQELIRMGRVKADQAA